MGFDALPSTLAWNYPVSMSFVGGRRRCTAHSKVDPTLSCIIAWHVRRGTKTLGRVPLFPPALSLLSSTVSEMPPPSFPIVRGTILGESPSILFSTCYQLTRPLLGISNVFAFVVLCLAAYTLSQTSPGYFIYSVLGVATASLHLVSVTAM